LSAPFSLWSPLIEPRFDLAIELAASVFKASLSRA
jgi:hypothetical protein